MTPLQEALAPRSDQLSSDDLITGPRTIRITGASILDAGREGKKVTIHFEGDNGKPYRPCKTMGRAMVMVWGITDESQFVGKSITVYRDPDVSFGPDQNIGGVRISHMSHIDGPKTVKLTVSRGKKSNFIFHPITAEVTPLTRGKQTAEEWAAEHMAAIAAVETADDLDALTTKAARAMAKLSTSNATTHGILMDAYNARRAELTGEGKPDEDRGEAFVDTDDVGF